MASTLDRGYRKRSKPCPRCLGTGCIEEVPEQLARKWRSSRRARDITLATMASRLKVSVAFVSSIERGKKPWPKGFEFRYLAALKA